MGEPVDRAWAPAHRLWVLVQGPSTPCSLNMYSKSWDIGLLPPVLPAWALLCHIGFWNLLFHVYCGKIILFDSLSNKHQHYCNTIQRPRKGSRRKNSMHKCPRKKSKRKSSTRKCPRKEAKRKRPDRQSRQVELEQRGLEGGTPGRQSTCGRR